MEHSKGASFGWAPALLANFRLGLKDLAGTNNLAYWVHSLGVNKKCYVNTVPGIVFTSLHFLLNLRMGLKS